VSVSDALQALSAAPGPNRLVGGGTDLLLDLQQGRHPPLHTLVDVTRVPEMTLIEARRDRLYVGAAVPLSWLVASPLVAEHAQALIEACSLIGGPQVRNTATLGGNVAHALPAADGAIALLALDAQVEIADPRGRRVVPLSDLYLGPGRSALEPQRHLLVGFHLSLKGPCQASAFQRVMRPQGAALPILNLACWLEREGDLIRQVRLALGPAGPAPLRARTAEETLRGQPLTPGTLSRAASALASEARFRTSPRRATADYRQQMAGVLLEKVVTRAFRLSQITVY
jgi:carbon-monoxide dehydrogenase medium subunit